MGSWYEHGCYHNPFINHSSKADNGWCNQMQNIIDNASFVGQSHHQRSCISLGSGTLLNSANNLAVATYCSDCIWHNVMMLPIVLSHAMMLCHIIIIWNKYYKLHVWHWYTPQKDTNQIIHSTCSTSLPHQLIEVSNALCGVCTKWWNSLWQCTLWCWW